jgi:hypothetical protein|tara:strand:- start:921 stop:1046 length:126 start_codon:yes stop_codon:yes gene_type:complete
MKFGLFVVLKFALLQNFFSSSSSQKHKKRIDAHLQRMLGGD